jgi:N-acetylneuraminic acid mutarotase
MPARSSRACGRNVRRRLALFLLALLASSSAGAQEVWTNLAKLPQPQCEAATAVLDGKIYVLGGWTSNSNNTWDAVQIYDPTLDKWSAGPRMPVAVNHAGAAVAGGKLYVVGGFLGPFRQREPTANVWAFDPATQKWEARAPLPAPAGSLVVGAIGDTIFAAGGERRRPFGENVPEGAAPAYVPIADFAMYDVKSDKWQILPPMNVARDHAVGGVIDGTLLVVGGRDRPRYDLAAVEIFDPASGKWRDGAPMPTGRSGGNAAALGGTLYVFGGEGNKANPLGIYTETEGYDLAKNAWTRFKPMPNPRHSLSAAAVGDRIYLPGGAPRAGGDVVTDILDSFKPTP